MNSLPQSTINQSILEVAIAAARSAGNLIKVAASDLNVLHITQKGLHDYVSEVDQNSEALILEKVKTHFPEHAFLGEEYGAKGNELSNVSWIVDPLDGTTNFLRAIPHYAVSIAVMIDAELEHAVIFDPIKDELFSASKGCGAQLNGRTINISGANGIRGGLLATGIPFSGKLLEDLSCFTKTMEAILAHNTSGIRRLGSAALDLAYVAAGRYDGYWESSLKPWDIAAGALIVKEAGGLVADFSGSNGYLDTGNIVAASPQLMDDMIEITARCYAKESH